MSAELRRGTRSFPRLLLPANALPRQSARPRGSAGFRGGRVGDDAGQRAVHVRLRGFTRGIVANEREFAGGVPRGGKIVGLRTHAGGSFAMLTRDPRESGIFGGFLKCEENRGSDNLGETGPRGGGGRRCPALSSVSPFPRFKGRVLRREQFPRVCCLTGGFFAIHEFARHCGHVDWLVDHAEGCEGGIPAVLRGSVPVFRGFGLPAEGDRARLRGGHAHRREGAAAAGQGAGEVGPAAAETPPKVETHGSFVDPEGRAVGEGAGRGAGRGRRGGGESRGRGIGETGGIAGNGENEGERVGGRGFGGAGGAGRRDPSI